MLEQLVNLVQQHTSNNAEIPDQQKEAVAQNATQSIESGIRQALQSGNLEDVLHLFSGKSDVASNPVAQNIQSDLAQNLSQQGVDASQAGSMAGSLIPNILNKLVHKTNDPNDSSFDLQGILNHFSGGGTSGFDVQGLMNKFKSGLDKDGDGDVDLQDLKSLFTSGGGLMDKVKGLFS